MIYMVEMDFRHPEREAEWHEWYLAHIRVLLTVPGFRASQRFQAIVDGTPSPYLALHEVASADLFDSAAYRSRGGPASTGEWQQLHADWQRNLLEGLDATPNVPADAYLLLLRDVHDGNLPEPAEVRWVRGVGLDRTVRECGIAVVRNPVPFVPLSLRDRRVRLYRPISEKLRAAGWSDRTASSALH
jgi:hypothetical protein